MHYHSNHMWCSASNWDGKGYNSRHMVSLEKYEGQYPNSVVSPDWRALVIDVKAKDEQGWPSTCPTLDPKVLEWLNQNVKPPVKPSDLKEDPHGWAMGNDEYRTLGSLSLHLWFYRRRDAMAFIRQWSKYKGPTSYLNYFSEYRWELDRATGKRILGR